MPTAIPDRQWQCVATALKRLGAYDLLDGADTGSLIQAHADLQGTQSLLRLCFSGKFTEEAASTGFPQPARPSSWERNHSTVCAKGLAETQTLISDVYDRIVGRD